MKDKLKRNFIVVMTIMTTLVNMVPSAVQAQEVQQNGLVSLKKEGSNYTFGNEYITRTFNVTDGKLKTDNITNYRTDTETVLTPENSEEFVINTLDNGLSGKGEFTPPQQKITYSNENPWNVESDSIATNEGSNGSPNLMFDGDINTYYHSQYENRNIESHNYPHSITIDFKESKNIQSIHYKQRMHNGRPTESGRVKDFKIYAADRKDDLANENNLKHEGSFENKEDTYINLDKVANAQFVKIVFVNAYESTDPGINKQVACCSEFEFFSDKATFPEKGVEIIKSSELELNEDPIENTIDGGKTLTFKFKPIVARGVEYTISEVITMKHGESFMRKHLEISVPENLAAKALIKHIDLENMNFAEKDTQGTIGQTDGNFWTIPEQRNNPDMGNMKGDYLELGQPYYVGAMYWGCEFPETENKIRPINNDENKYNGFIRYHYGKSLAIDTQFTEYNDYNNAGGKAGKMVTWDAVVGAARSTDYSVVQADFYEYIETIATPTEFRQQFNSWYDNMKNINAENIKSSFNEIEKGFTQHGVNPLDSYVVDDGWINYNSFWDFDRSQNKFPNELYDSSLQVGQLGSNFGLWLGPRGGYGTERTIANYIVRNNLGSRNEKQNDINISDARYLNKLLKDIFIGYQEKFDINYWKLDGMLLNPSTNASNHHVVGNPLYTISETYERWTDMYEAMREQRGDKGLWINMTSYTNPSPWHLQWVNSVWMQNTGDTGYDDKFNNTAEEAMLTYRDNDYYEFFNERQWQLPNKYFYNHDPVYGLTANDSYPLHGRPRPDIEYSNEEMRNHLYMLGTRGTAFWEYYYSPSMFNDDLWDINAEAANWIKDNFNILQKSKMFGGQPSRGEVYGYSCWNGSDGIISLRNPSDREQRYTVKYDRLIGVGESTKDVYGKVVVGDIDKYQIDKALSYGDEITYTLKPKEVLIMQYGEKDTTSATIKSIHGDGNKVEVEFNETIREPNKENFIVKDNVVESVLLKEDLRTVELTLKEKIKDATNIEVSVDGVLDVVGNSSKVSAVNDYYENDIVNSVVDRILDGREINKGNAYSIDGNGGFSVTGKLSTTSKNAEIVRQEGSYSVGIDDEGYLTFTLDGVTVNSKYVQKTRQQDGTVTSETKGIIADGKEHQFSAVKEVNGMLKLYIDGELVASAYDKNKINPNIEKGDLVFGKNLEGRSSYITVLDKALAYDEVYDYVDIEGNVMSRAINSQVKVSAYDVTENKVVAEKADRPFSHLNDGNKNYQSNYLELRDTANNKNHSRYIEIDLGSVHELNKVHLTRYADRRVYGPTVIALSEDKGFTNSTIVYNSDKTGNVHNLGQGNDELYQETQNGKEVTFEPTNARYIRIYVNGRTGNQGTSDHIVEFEAYGTKKAENVYRIDYSRLDSLVNEELFSIYTNSSIATYKKNAADVITQAKQLLEGRNVNSDAEVEVLINKINEYRNVLVKRADITAAEAYLEEIEGLNEANYSVESWKEFADAKTALLKALENIEDLDQEALDTLLSELKMARDELMLVETTQLGNLDFENPEQKLDENIHYIYSKEAVAPEENENVRTGDTANIGILLTAMLLAGSGITGLSLKKKKK